VAFSIAHEISHTFFPNSITGARFRNICANESKEANELERLCDLGASELLMPTSAFQAAAGSVGFSLSNVPTLMQFFGSSFEATAFRLASAHPGIAIAGLLRYRLRIGDSVRSGAYPKHSCSSSTLNPVTQNHNPSTVGNPFIFLSCAKTAI
jgi:hypothetical protein